MANEETIEIPITKVQWGLRGAQVFFALLAMFIISAVIGWDNRFFSASLLSVFFLFIILVSIFFAAAIVAIPYFYNTKGKFKNAARALAVPRIEFVLSAIWAVLILLATFLLTIDAYALRKCDPSDPRYENYTSDSSLNETFYTGLPNICRTQRAANAFGWFALTAWLCSLVLIANDMRKNRRQPVPQDPPTYHSKPSNSSASSSEHGLPMQTTHSTPYSPTQQPQQYQQQISSPPMPPSFPESGPGQGQGQNPEVTFPEPHHF